MIGPGGNKDAEVFADALEGRGPRDSEVQQLVRFAESLCETALDPSADFVLNLRADLMADAASVLVDTRKTARLASVHTASHPVRKRLAAATAGVLATAGMLGIVASSAQALPGEMLYPVKRGVESIELTMHRSDAGHGSFQLAQATERLAEAQALASKSDAHSDDLVVKSLSEFADTASSGSESLFSDYTGNGANEESINKVNGFATSASSVLSDLSRGLAPSAEEAFKRAASTVTSLASQASTLCGSCDPAQLTSLASSVASFIGDKDTGSTTDKPVTADAASKTTGTESTAPKLSPTLLPALEPSVISISPSPSPTGSTDSPLGGLLGDDDQTGLVPGLVGGLLGE